MVEVCRFGGFGQKTGVGVCGGAFGLWWVLRLKVKRSGKVEVLGVLWRSLGEFEGLWCGEF